MFFKYLLFAHFLMLRPPSAVLVLDYDEVVFRSFNSSSIDVRTNIVLPAVWQLAAFKVNMLKYFPSELV